MIECKQLTKVFGDRTAVRDLTVKLPNGGIYGLLGPRGAGTSTLLAMMAGALEPTAGDVRINGFSLLAEPKKAKTRIGYLPEDYEPEECLTPLEALSFVAEVRERSRERGQRQIRDTLELLALDGAEDRLLRSLTRAQRRRTALAETLIGGTEILLLDAPVKGLSKKDAAALREVIRKLGDTHTVFISSHTPAELEGVCDRILLLSEGRLLEYAPAEDLLQDARLPTLFPAGAKGDSSVRDTSAVDEPVFDGEYELIDTHTKGDA
ncbi:MAG: ABC transporter ATP-binding protein [Clostridia bacterium]|nr:ABC transporter ATP-binding protein [Clostridia bacterium]